VRQEPSNRVFFHSSKVVVCARRKCTGFYVEQREDSPLVFLSVLQSCYSAKGALQDVAQESSIDRDGVATDWSPAEPWMVSLRYSSVRQHCYRVVIAGLVLKERVTWKEGCFIARESLLI
jgi:hypothetical protein